MTDSHIPKSSGEMMADIMGNVSNLVRNEADLARTELAESLNKAGAAIGAMVLAVALAITGLNVLAVFLVTLVAAAGIPAHWAAIVVGAGLLLIAFAIYSTAKSALNQIGFVPTRAARNVQRDVAAFKGSIDDK